MKPASLPKPGDPVDDAPAIACRKLGKQYAEGPLRVEVLDQLDFTVAAGERVAVMGASGSGKSTLLHLLGGLDTPSAGEVHICGHNMAQLGDAERGLLRNRTLGFIYQFHHLLPEFTALENVAIPLLVGGCRPREAAERARELLTEVGLGKRCHHKPAELSGGERQRVAISRALINHPRAVLADEPTGNLDRRTADQVGGQMLSLNEASGTSIVIATHDPEVAAGMDRVYTLEEGRLQLVRSAA